MPKLSIQNFGGVVPRTSSTFLKDNEAQVAENTRLYAGELRAWRGSLVDYTPATPNLNTIYRFRNPAEPDAPVWLTWTSDVDVVPYPGTDISELRLYYTGDGAPKKTNWTLATTGTGDLPRASLNMGVPAPTTKPTVATNNTGTAAAEDTRAYVYTYVSAFGSLTEESAPSPPSDLHTIEIGESVDISDFTAPPTDGYNITKIRLYRTMTGGEAGAYAFVTEIDVSSLPTTYNDDKSAAEMGEALSTIGWTPPPADLAGIVSMSNGMLAGFVGNTVYFSEPYFPHSWPTRYAQTVPERIVGLGSYGNALVVATQGRPHIMMGAAPEVMSVEHLPLPEPCVSKKSIAYDQYGVLYASPNGLVAIGPSIQAVVTNELFRRNEWQEYNPETLRGAIFDGKYVAAFLSDEHGYRTMVLSRDDHPAMHFLGIRATALHTDMQRSELYYFDPEDDRIYQADADPLRPRIYEWKSKRFSLPKGMTFSVLKLEIDSRQQDSQEVYLELLADVQAKNEVIFATMPLAGGINEMPLNVFEVNGDNMLPLPSPAEALVATVLLYGDRGELMATFSISNSDPLRIPAFRSREIEVQISGTTNVHGFAMATSLRELLG